jgi:integrase
MDFNKLLDRANARLKSGKVGVRVVRIGNRLSLQATLPPKPNSTKIKPHQQKIFLGIYFNADGISRAEQEAKKLGGLLACKEFSWSLYLDDCLDALTVGKAIAQFEADYFSKRSRTPETDSTWKWEYLQVFTKMPVNAPISEKLLRETVLLSEPNTRSRKRYAYACAKLADLAGLKHNLRELAGDYSINKVKPRDLPSDSAIAIWHSAMPDNLWAWIYGMMAVYGLRNHEIFFVDLADFPVIFVEKGKTNERYVYPIYPEWSERWSLQNRPDLPFTGKNNLRHAWAVRSLEFGMDVSLAAAQMGHSVQVHCQVYHHWISKDVHQRAYQALLNRVDRPRAPMG